MTSSLPPIGGSFGEYPAPVNKPSNKILENLKLPNSSGKQTNPEIIKKNCHDLRNMATQIPDVLDRLTEEISDGKFPIVPLVSINREFAAVKILGYVGALIKVAMRRSEYEK